MAAIYIKKLHYIIVKKSTQTRMLNTKIHTKYTHTYNTDFKSRAPNCLAEVPMEKINPTSRKKVLCRSMLRVGLANMLNTGNNKNWPEEHINMLMTYSSRVWKRETTKTYMR